MKFTMSSLMPLSEDVIKTNTDFVAISRQVRDIMANFRKNVNNRTLDKIKRRYAYIVHILKDSNTNINTTNINNRNKLARFVDTDYPPLGQMVGNLKRLKARKNQKNKAATRIQEARRAMVARRNAATRIQAASRGMLARREANQERRRQMKNEINKFINEIQRQQQQQNFGNGNRNGNGNTVSSAGSSS